MTLAVYLNGIEEALYTCNAEIGQAARPNLAVKPRTGSTFGNSSCNGSISLSSQSLPVPATLSSYEVVLTINAYWEDESDTSISVTVPGNASIDLLAPLTVSAPAAPAMSPLALGMTALLIGVAAYRKIYPLDS